MILKPWRELDPEDLPKKKMKVYMMQEQKFREVKQKIANYMNMKEVDATKFTRPDNLRIWKCNYYYSSVDRFSEFLKEHSIGGVNTQFRENENPDIDENTGVSFPGT